MKTTLVFEFGTPAEAQQFLSQLSGNSPQVAQTPATPQPIAAAPQAYAPPAAAPQPVYPPPPAAAPQPVAAAPQAGAPLAPDGQPWTIQKALPFMQQYAQTFKAAGVKAVFDRYQAPPMLPNCDANQLALVATHFASMQPA